MGQALNLTATIDRDAVADSLSRFKGGATVGMVWAVCKLEHLDPSAVHAWLNYLIETGEATRSGVTYYPRKAAQDNGN